jgi:hypothetical protein
MTVSSTEIPGRRSSPRRPADWRVLFGLAGQLVPGFLADISPIGVSIASEKEYPVGTEIIVHFCSEEGQPAGRLQLRAIVRHSGKGRIGAQLLNANPSERGPWWKIQPGAV